MKKSILIPRRGCDSTGTTFARILDRFIMRGSEHSPSSNSLDAAAFWLLDALVDGPSSFAASFVFIREAWKVEGARGLSVDQQLGVVREMERKGYVEVRLDSGHGAVPVSASERQRIEDEYRNWLRYLPAITAKDVVYDFVGLWMALTAQGRVEWSRLAKADPQSPGSGWTADYDAQSSVIRVTGPTPNAALTRAIELAQRLGMEIETDSETRRLIDGGVEVNFLVRPAHE